MGWVLIKISFDIILLLTRYTMLTKQLQPLGTAVGHSTVKTYSGSVDVVRQTLRQRGVTGLYKGVQVLLTGTIPTYALR